MIVSKIAHFSGHKDAIFALSDSTKGNTFYSGGADGYVVEWDIESKQNGKLLVQVPRPVYCLHLLKDKQLLLCGTAAGNLHVVDLAQGKEIRNIEAHQLGIYDIKEIDSCIITSGGDGKVMLWDKETFKLLETLHFANKSARVIAIHPTQSKFAVGYSDHYIRLFDTQKSILLHENKAHENSVFALAFSVNGKELISGGRDVMLKKWQAEQFDSLAENIPAHNLHINAVQFNSEGDLFITGSMDKTIKIWDAHTFKLLKVVDKARNDGHLSSVNKAIWFDAKRFITCSDDRTVMMWEMEKSSIELIE